MEDVNARIVIAAESGDSLKSINGVKRGLSEITDSRMKDLKIAQAKSKLELAEYRSAIAAQKAYNAEIKLEGAVKRLNFRRSNGAREKEIQQMEKSVESLRAEYLSLANAESSANLVAYQAKKNLDNLNASLAENSKATAFASKNMRQFSTSATAARAAGRLFGIDVSEGVNPALIKQGIIVAGIVSAVKVAGTVYGWFREKLKDAAEIAGENSESVRKVAERNKELSELQRSAMDSLSSMQNQEKLSNVERVKTSNLLKQLGSDYRQLGIEIDASTGKITNFEQVNAKLSRLQIKREQKDIQRLLKNLADERNRQQEIIDTSGFSGWWLAGIPQLLTWNRNTRIGGKKEALAAAKEINRIGEESSKLRARLAELQRLNPEADLAATLKDRAQAVPLLIEAEKKQFEIQRARNRGDEEGAAWMERRLELQRQINGLTAEELKRYRLVWIARREAMTADRINEMRAGILQNQQIRALRERGEFKQADWLEYRGQNLRGVSGASAYQAWKNWSADYDSRLQYEHRERLNNLKDELRIEQLLLSGDERRARAAKWQNELKRQGVTAQAAEAEIAMRERLYQARQFRQDWSAAVQRAKSVNSYRFRSTSQTAVFANSVDALRLQSRVMTQSPEMKVQQSQLDTLRQIKNGIDRLVGPSRTAPNLVRS